MWTTPSHPLLIMLQEWDGDTADVPFASEILREFDLLRTVALPQWTDTAHDLTLWRRQGQHRAGHRVIRVLLLLRDGLWVIYNLIFQGVEPSASSYRPAEVPPLP